MTNRCQDCRDGAAFDGRITMAFQPIVDVSSGAVFAYEALVRGVNGEGAEDVLARVSPDNQYAFDQLCRTRAIELAADLRLAETGALLSINFLPNAVYEPRACIRQTLTTAMRTKFPIRNILFEFTEAERLESDHAAHIVRTYRSMGFRTAIDDFGAGYSGLGLLSKFQTDFVKIDMDLVRHIDRTPAKQAIVKNTLAMLRDLGVTAICEGVETDAEVATLAAYGVDLMQGFYFAKPAREALPELLRSPLAARSAAG